MTRLRFKLALFALSTVTACSGPVPVGHAEAALETETLSEEEAAALLEKATELGMAPETGDVIDVFITAATGAYPPAAGALAAFKGLASVMGFLDKGNAVADALNALELRLNAAIARIAALENKINQIQNELFEDENRERTRELKDRLADIEAIIHDLSLAPADTFTRQSLAYRGQIQADRFLKENDWDFWQWSDLHVYRNPSTGQIQADRLPPDFKSLPMLEAYSTALLTWMTAIENASDGDTTWVKQTYGAALMKHVAFLSTRAGYTRDQAPETLPENVKSRIACYFKSFGRDAATGECYVNDACHDGMARRERYLGSRTFAGDATCDPVHESIRTDAQDALEDSYGVALMSRLAERLRRLAETGTVKQPAPVTPPTYYHELFGVAPNGDLLWHDDAITISSTECPGTIGDTSLDLPNLSPYGTTSVSDALHGSPSPGTTLSGAGGIGAVTTAAGTTPEYSCLAATGPKKIGNGWDIFKDLLPAGGRSLFGLEPDGKLLWYRYDGFGAAPWKGAITVGTGWNIYDRVFAGSDGVLYGIAPNGDLFWYRLVNYDLPSPAPQWLGRKWIADGFNRFVHVFGAEGGVVYAVAADGRLFWARHDSATGTLLSPLKEVGQGWADFARIFAAGNDGNIYAVTKTGEVYWYQHTGWPTGTPSWRGPRPVVADLKDLTRTFALTDASSTSLH